MRLALPLVERGLVPDSLVRFGIRRLLAERLDEQAAAWGRGGDAEHEASMQRWLAEMRSAEVAPLAELANDQHYEVPAPFFELVLGPHLKYSSCWFDAPSDDLATAEERMLAKTCERARLADGQQILELGCGWGSLSLWMAARYPDSKITAVSNSAPQRRFIEQRAQERGLTNVTVLTRDMNHFDPREVAPAGGFERVVSVEMFEHMRNWEALLGRVRNSLSDAGLLFTHVFAHRRFAYPFEVRDASDWMSRYFFSGGQMPSDDLFERVEAPFEKVDHWVVDGRHYAQTAEAWLANLDAARTQVREALLPVYGADTGRWIQRWRVFFMSCAELFGYRDGQEWWVSHELMRPLPVTVEASPGGQR